MNVSRSTFEDAGFTVPLIARARKEYDRSKLAAARAQEAIQQLGLVPAVRMADHVNVSPYYPSVTLSFQECVRPWLIPHITSLELPWELEWELSSYGFWDTDHWTMKTTRVQESACHVMTLRYPFLRSNGVNGRKRYPVDHVQLRIHQPAPAWEGNQLILPNGCVCEKSMEAYVDDVVTTCRLPS